MKKQHIALFFCLLLLTVFLFSLNLHFFTAKTDSSVTLQIRIMNELKNEEHVLQEFEDRTFDDLGLHISLKSQSSDSYHHNLSSLLHTNNNIDLVFDAPWLKMNQNIADGLYLDLEPYLNSGKYQGLLSAFSSRYLNDSCINGHLYGLPITKNYYDPPGIIYRKDLLESYHLGFDEIQNLDQLQQFYDAVLKNNPEMYPLSVGRRGFYYLLLEDAIKLQNENVFDVTGISWPTFPVKVVLSSDQKTVKNVIFLGDEQEELQKAGVDIRDYFKEAYLKQADWNCYLSPDSLISSDSSYALLNGQAASFEQTLGEGTISLQDQLQKQFPQATLAFFPSDASLQSLSDDLTIAKGLTAWNYVCIPKNSDHIEETLSFLDWMFASQENNDLLTYGVEGTDWIRAGEQEYRLPEDQEQTYRIPSYTLSYNPKYLRYESRLNENEKRLIQKTADPDTFTGSPLTGFGLDYTTFSARWNDILSLYQEYHLQFMHGTYGSETAGKIQEFHARAKQLGLNEMRQEIAEQIQNYLDQLSSDSSR